MIDKRAATAEARQWRRDMAARLGGKAEAREALTNTKHREAADFAAQMERVKQQAAGGPVKPLTEAEVGRHVQLAQELFHAEAAFRHGGDALAQVSSVVPAKRRWFRRRAKTS